jgi:8-oxo-dGTP pyrophosphatase MutT (NUDIX family)
MSDQRPDQPTHDTENPWQTRAVASVYENPWIEVSHHDVIKPSGADGIYGVVHFKNLALGIVALDAQGHTWLVGQYRYPLGRYSWEIPEGGGPHGTSPLESARRELQEETGIEAGVWTHLLDMDLSNSVTDESAVVFVAQGLTFGVSAPEDTERLTVRRLPFAEALAMVLRGDISDAISMVAILKTSEWLRSGRITLIADRC